MKQTLLLAVLASTVLAGCASQHKLTQPSGRWQAVNQLALYQPMQNASTRA
ncbi:YgdI/YgdR family lipoprotein [Moraxella sp. FZLJ2107]|uniref:YgdI/YgdR family lipoprotein n=1 Tax=unclassified Moraxella TaxID=2685852 RepID=UPI0020C8F456|nr:MULTISPECIES: YgdI/YgdR family lipoprotein [unclassified Moraxella]UTO05693.1 YgdI/YgdR family lipoprotein [Moraxella sp. FZLJ2107]UTO22429.1 YgdI/YgdR family lipoprotein [Moraxella sp. FZLJ2109]